MGYIFSAFTLAYAAFEIPSGWLGDYFGTRKALTRIVLWWSIFTALTAAATGFASLVMVRFLFGAGEAGAFPNIARSISRWFPASHQGRALSVAFVGNAVGAAISLPLVLKLVVYQGWRLPFVEFGAVGVVWALVWYWWFRDRPEEHKAVNAEELRFIRSDEMDADQLGHTRHVPWGILLRSSNLAFICGMYFAFSYALYFYITWLPTYLLTARGFSPTYAGFFSALPWVASAGGFWLGGESPSAPPVVGRNPRTICHPGAGGSIGWADPDARLAVAICHNRMFDAPTPEGNPFVPIGNAVREALGVAG